MKEEVSKEGAGEDCSTLSQFLQGDLAASKYLKRLEDVIGAPGETERELASELCLAEPALISKVVELSRLSSDPKVDSRIRSAIRALSMQIIREIDPELQDWAKSGETSPEGNLSLLGSRLRKARVKANKEAIASAEQVLRLGLIVTSTHPDFDIVSSLALLQRSLTKERTDQRTLSQKMSKFALRSSPKVLESLAELTRLVRFETDPLRADLAEMEKHLQSCRNRNFDLQNSKDKLEQELEEERKLNDDLKAKVAELEVKIGGVMGGADQNMIELKARVRNLLRKKLQPNLDEALLGLEHEPPQVEFAQHRLNILKREIWKEVEWLTKS
jgi:hypothetical protein